MEMTFKYLIRILLPALAVTLATAACTKDLSHSGLDPESPVPSEEPIEFAVGGGTKGQTPITSLAELAKRDFSVSAWYTPEGETFDVPGNTSIKYFENHRFGYLTDDPDHDAFSALYYPEGYARREQTGSIYFPAAGSWRNFSAVVNDGVIIWLTTMQSGVNYRIQSGSVSTNNQGSSAPVRCIRLH